MELTGIVQALIQGLAFGGIFALIAAGMTLVHNVTTQINVAHGTFMILCIYIMYSLNAAFNLDPYIAMLVAIPIMVLFGLLVWYLTFKKVVYHDHLMVFQFFIAWVLIVEHVLLIVYSADSQSVTSFVTGRKVELGAVVIEIPRLISFVVAVAVIGFFYWLLRRTDFGRSVRATAQRPDIAPLMGINVGRLQMLVFCLAAVLLAIAAGMLLPYFTFSPYHGLFLTLFGLIILVLGGFGSWEGTLIASLLIGLTYGISFFYIPTGLAAIVPYLMFALVLIFRPHGLFGMR